MADGKPTVFGENTAKKIKRFVDEREGPPRRIEKVVRVAQEDLQDPQLQVHKIGKADSAISYDSSGTVSVRKRNDSGTLVDTGDNITAYLDWMHGDENVSSGKEVLCTWFADEQIWRITGAECE